MSARADFAKVIIISWKSLLQNKHRTENLLSFICKIRHTAQTHSGNKIQFLKKNKWMWTLTFPLTKERETSSHKCTHKIVIQLQFEKTKSWVGAILLGWICKTQKGYCFDGILDKLICYLVALYSSTLSNLFRHTKGKQNEIVIDV